MLSKALQRKGPHGLGRQKGFLLGKSGWATWQSLPASPSPSPAVAAQPQRSPLLSQAQGSELLPLPPGCSVKPLTSSTAQPPKDARALRLCQLEPVKDILLRESVASQGLQRELAASSWIPALCFPGKSRVCETQTGPNAALLFISSSSSQWLVPLVRSA